MNVRATIVFLFGLAQVVVGASGFIWRDCGGSLVTFKQVVIEPLPLLITRSSVHYLSTQVTLKRDLPEDAELALIINKTVQIGAMSIPYAIPCTADGFGSCRYRFCDIFENEMTSSLICPFFTSSSQECSCPMKKGNYSAKRVQVKIPFENLNGLAANAAAANGEYSVRMLIQNQANTKSFACMDAKFYVELYLD